MNYISKYLELIYDNLQEYIGLIKKSNDDYILLSANNNFASLFNLTKDEIEGKYLKDALTNKLNYEDICKHYNESLKSKKPLNFTKEYKSVNGFRTFEINLIPIIENNDENYILIVATDLTELYDAEKELKEKERKYELITENSSDIITETDDQGVITFVSAAVKNILGYDSEDLLFKSFYSFIHPDDLLTIAESFKNSDLKYKFSSPIIYRVKNKDNEYVWVESTLNPIYNGTKEIGYVSVSRNVTERKKLQDKLRKYIDELEELNKKYSENPMSLDEVKSHINTNRRK